ncbi:hypothetical protein [Listeria seeligeri]|nr:hypothetical protein [Listeria seeligeri]
MTHVRYEGHKNKSLTNGTAEVCWFITADYISNYSAGVRGFFDV